MFKNRKMAYFVGAVMLALAATGGVFAYGFINSTTSLSATTVQSNFADVTANNTAGSWVAVGNTKGSITGGSLFNIVPSTDYTGDLIVTVSIGNADSLAKIYRNLSLQLQLVNTDNVSQVIDIDTDNTTTGDWVMLSLDNGSVSMYPAASGNMTVMATSGFYQTQVHPKDGWKSGYDAAPDLFCEVAQR